MRNNYTRLLLLLSFLFSGLACEDTNPFPVEETKPKLVVQSTFTSNRTVEVEVSRTRSIFQPDDRQTHVLNATVRIFEGDRFLETLILDNRRNPPVYVTSKLIPQPKISYTVQVTAPGFDAVTARSRIPSTIRISGLTVSFLQEAVGNLPEERQINYQVSLDFQDPAEEVNYYHLNFLQQVNPGKPAPGDTVIYKPTRRQMEFAPFASDYFVRAQSGGLLFPDDAFNGQTFSSSFPLRINLRGPERLGKLFVELRAVSDDYYLYETSRTRQVDGPGPPIQGESIVYNNVENGQGIFAGYNLSVDSVVVIQ